MARTDGPGVKGLVVLVNDEKAESTQLIVEPLHLNDAEYIAMLAGGSYSGSVIADLAWTTIRYSQLTVGTLDTVSITDSLLLPVGNATETTFTATFTALPVLPSSLEITADSIVATDDGLGALSGTGVTSGTIDYDTGAVSLVLAAAPASEVPVTAVYTRGE